MGINEANIPMPPRPVSEDEVRQGLVEVLKDIGCPDIRLNMRAKGAERCDIFSESWRIVCETKKANEANPAGLSQRNPQNPKETQREQLQRYMIYFRDQVFERLNFEGSADAEQDWRGCLVDDRNAWFYTLSGARGASELVETHQCAIYTLGLRDILAQHLGKPAKPGLRPVPEDLRGALQSEHANLVELSASVSGTQSYRTKFSLWEKVMTPGGLIAEGANRGDLFVNHTLLVCVARSAIRVLTGERSPSDGSILESHFASWVLQRQSGRVWLNQLERRIASWSWALHSRDVLKGLYESLIDPSTRHDFGEVYTPDWVAAAVCEKVLDEPWMRRSIHAALEHSTGEPGQPLSGVGVLDPACGSGTFLFQAAKRILESKAMSVWELGAQDQANVVCRLVQGLDVHPIAIEIARATLLSALPAAPRHGSRALQIAQGDAFASGAFAKKEQYGLPGYELQIGTPEKRYIELNEDVLHHEHFSEIVHRIVTHGRDLHESGEQADVAEVRAFIEQHNWHERVPAPRRQIFLATLEKATAKIHEICSHEDNHVWEWFIHNATAPIRLRHSKVDRIVANPPWVELNSMHPHRKHELRKVMNHYQVWTGGKNATHCQIAIPFICEAVDKFLAGNSRHGWVLPASALKAQPWAKFRAIHPRWNLIADLSEMQERIFPGPNQPCILVSGKRLHFGEREIWRAKPGETIPANATWGHAKPRIRISSPPLPFPEQASEPYGKGPRKFLKGAKIVPYSLVMIDEDPGDERFTCVQSTTGYWREQEPMRGAQLSDNIHPVLAGENCLPFRIEGQRFAVLPLSRKNPQQLCVKEQGQQFQRYWKKAERAWKEYREIKHSNIATLLENIEYRRGVSAQLPLRRRDAGRRVIYNSSGKSLLRAARTAKFPEAIINKDAYYYIAKSQKEALYLVGVLNAPCLGAAIFQSKTSELHFDLNPVKKIPIPAFRPKSKLHGRIAEISGQCEKLAAKVDLSKLRGQSNRTKAVQRALREAGLFDKLDAAVRKLLPNHAQKKP